MSRALRCGRRELGQAGKKSTWLIAALLFLAAMLAAPWQAKAQEWFRTATGLGVAKARVAVADFAPRAASVQPHSKLFTDVVREDLQFSGVLEVVSPSFYPVPPPSLPSELKQQAWANPPASSHLVGFG